MKRTFVVAMMLAVFLLNGCGQNSSVTGVTTPPAISNLSFSPSSANAGDGGGAITVRAYIDFIDNDGDLNAVTLKTASGTNIIPITGTDGMKTGSVYVSVVISTAIKGNFAFETWITDKANNTSNHLSGAFSIL